VSRIKARTGRRVLLIIAFVVRITGLVICLMPVNRVRY